MAGGHLQRTGYRHGVLAIAGLSALVAAMYTHSSFIDPLSKTPYAISPVLGDAYTKPHRFAIVIIVLNAASCALTALMSLFLDWHFAIRTPAYVEFSWIGLVCCAELVSVVLAGISKPHADVCSLDRTPLGSYEGLVMMGRRVCSNWTAILVTSVMSLVALTFHFTWHMVFRLWHRATLARRPTSPIDIWNTPLPKYYPINPHEAQKKDDPVFLALDDSERGAKPEDSIAMDPYSRIFRPIAVRNAERVAQEGVKNYELPVVNVTAPIEDQGVVHMQDNPSEVALCSPPGLGTITKEYSPHPPFD